MSVKVVIRSAPLTEITDFHLSAGLVEALRLLLHLCKPASMALFVMAAWRFCADLGWTSDFVISEGIFSHWQVWGALGLALSGIQSELEKRDLAYSLAVPLRSDGPHRVNSR